jgi:hypothetical protein
VGSRLDHPLNKGAPQATDEMSARSAITEMKASNLARLSVIKAKYAHDEYSEKTITEHKPDDPGY